MKMKHLFCCLLAVLLTYTLVVSDNTVSAFASNKIPSENGSSVVQNLENGSYEVSRSNTTLTLKSASSVNQQRIATSKTTEFTAMAAALDNHANQYTTNVTATSKNDVKVETIIGNSITPLDFQYEISLPTGWTMELPNNNDDGLNTAVLLYNEEHIVLGAIYDLSAQDSAGNTVDATFGLQDNHLVVSLDAANNQLEYPLSSTFGVLPQYTFEDFFYGEDSSFFDENPNYPFGFTVEEQGIRLNLYPNKLADGWYLHTVSNIDNVVLDTSWYTVCDYFDMGMDFYNLQGMFEQFWCHLHFAWPYFQHEIDWNLEQWRPCVGAAATAAAKCNP